MNKHIRYTPERPDEITSAVTSASLNLESGGCCIYLGNERVDCTLDELRETILSCGGLLVPGLQRIAAEKLGGAIEDVPEPEPDTDE